MGCRMKDRTRILIGGDLYPGGRLERLFVDGDAQALFGEFIEDFRQADFSIVDLECPIVDDPSTPIDKAGPNLRAPSGAVNGLVAAGIDAVTLANNHVLDYGEAGVESTLAACREAGVSTVGAGADLASAGQLLLKTVNGTRLAFYACAEREFSVASPSRAGANPLDLIHFAETVRDCRDAFDHLVVLYHGGVEWYPFPPPEMQRRCRFMIDSGATAVVCTHAHCPVSYETRGDGLIVYGQGNLLFDHKDVAFDAWYEGVLVELELDNAGTLSHRFMHYKQRSETPKIHRPDDETLVAMAAAFEERSRITRDEDALREQWRRFCTRERKFYLHMLHADYPLLQWAACRSKRFANLLHREPERRLARNSVRCESHREILTTLIDAVDQGWDPWTEEEDRSS